jgi:acid phosphatase family membrane protein YuiD
MYTSSMTEDFAWYRNVSIWSGLAAWLLAQSVKMASAYRARRELDFGVLVSTGGMPSAHSAAVSALATSVGLTDGFSSGLFAVALAFAVIVMFDAQSVRQAAGLQARILNQIVEELFKEHHLSQQKLAELLGHTRLEVFAGMTVGILTALAIRLL